MAFPKKKQATKKGYQSQKATGNSAKSAPTVLSNCIQASNVTRKQKRKQVRLQKKARRHAFFTRHLNDMTKDSGLSNQEVTEDNKTLPSKESKDLSKIKQRKTEKTENLQIKRRKLLMIEENKREEKNIHMLEKRLKMNRRKSKSLPKCFINDGLDYLLDICDKDKISTLREPDLSDAISEFDEDFALVTGQMETSNRDGKRRKITFSEATPEVNSIDHRSIGHNNLEDEMDDCITVSSIEGSLKLEDEEGYDKAIASGKSSSRVREKCIVKRSEQTLSKSHLPLEQQSKSCGFKSLSSEDGGDADTDSVKSDDGQRHKENKLTKSVWEDIYGRFRDKDGNIIENKHVNHRGYIPPPLRQLPSIKDAPKAELMERLKKQLKGLLNRLSESNVKPISSEIEELYMKHSRNDINDTLINLVMTSTVQIVLTPERLVQEHALLIALLHANIGPEVGAQFLEQIVGKFIDIRKNKESYGEGKECNNVLLLLVQLYTFKVVHSAIIYDMLHLLAEAFLEKDVELILLVLRSAGFTLRKDDPLRLKNVIIKLQSRANDVSHLQDQARVRFMMDTLMAVRNNNMNKIPNYDPSHTEHLKKLLRGLIRKGNSVVELKISLDDLLNVESRGRWWVVGSAWAGEQITESKPVTNMSLSSVVENVSDKILECARKQRMNTDVRKTIFCVIMTAEDYIDAFEKLLRLGLNSQQEREIIHVAMECCLQEKSFNVYYAFLLQRFCNSNRKYQLATQFAVWDKIKELNTITSLQLSNLAHLLSHLFIEQALAISILKVIEFSEMEKMCVRFLRQILLKVLLHDPECDVENVFIKVARSPKLHMFREGICLFMQHFMLKNKEKLPQQVHQKLQRRIQVAKNVLTSCEVLTKF